MKQLIVLIFIIQGVCFFINEVSAQQITWEKIFNRQGQFYRAIQTSSKDYVVVGTERINNYNKILLMKLNQFGDTLWKRIIGPIVNEGIVGVGLSKLKIMVLLLQAMEKE